MPVNNFKELEKQSIAEIGSAPAQIETKLSQNLSVFRFIGEMIELYIPTFGKSLIKMSSPPEPTPKPKYPNQE